MKSIQSSLYFSTNMIINNRRLGKVPEVHQGTDSRNEVIRRFASYDTHDVSLNVSMFSSSHLLHLRNPLPEMSEAGVRLEDRKPEVNFMFTEDMDAPLHVVVPELFVPMMEWFRREKYRWIGQRPVSPKRKMHAIKP